MECSICRESKEVFKCDECGILVCKLCGKLTSSEVKVLQLASRVMRFHCDECKAVVKPLFTKAELLKGLLSMEESMMGSFNASLSSLRGDFETKLTGLTEQVSMLRESNIQLLHLIMPQSLNFEKSCANPASLDCEKSCSIPASLNCEKSCSNPASTGGRAPRPVLTKFKQRGPQLANPVLSLLISLSPAVQ